MATKPFHYQEPFPLGPDTTEYQLITKDYVKVENWNGHEMLVVDPEALTVLANVASHNCSFMLRREHNEMVAKILGDPEASDNDRFVALTMLRNAEVAAKGVLPFCQDTGTSICAAYKGQQVWTGCDDEEKISLGVYKTYTENNLRYSQNAPLTMYEEVNTGCNLPAQIDIHATEGDEYKFLFVAKGGGSANKTYLYQETKAILNPKTLVPFLIEKMKTLGTAACPPYHIAFVIGGTSAEANLAAVKKASVKYYDNLPTSGNEYGRAFRDVELEKELLEAAHCLGLGAQFGGKYFAHDIRVIRMPRHGASCPVGMGVSCSADRNVKAKIKERLDAGDEMPQYLKDHPIYYAGPAKKPEGMPSGSFGPTTAGRMDSYVDQFQAAGGSMVMIAKGNRSQQVTDACHKHGGFYVGSIGGPAAILAQNSIKDVQLLEYPELGMEAIWKIEVEDFPAFILVDNKGNDFFKQIKPRCPMDCGK